MGWIAQGARRAQVGDRGAGHASYGQPSLRFLLRRRADGITGSSRTHRRCGYQREDTAGGGKSGTGSVPWHSNTGIRSASHHGDGIYAKATIEPLQGTNQMEGWRCAPEPVKTTAYFDLVRLRAGRGMIKDIWMERAIRAPVREKLQADGQIRRWARVPEMENRYLRVILFARSP